MIKIIFSGDRSPYKEDVRSICLLRIYGFIFKNMTNGILCATDFSDSSGEALKWAVDLAKKLGSHLTILYAYRLLRQNGEAVDMKRKMEAEAKENFERLERELFSGAGISYDLKIEVGFIDDRIEEHLKKNKVSFLVMGKGLTILNKDTFDDLVNHLHLPLVIVPEIIN